MKDKPKILVYNNQLLPVSETFVYNQSVKLVGFESYFLGAKASGVSYFNLPENRIFLINRGGKGGLVREAAFKLFGYVPNNLKAWARNVKPVLLHAHFGSGGAMTISLANQLHLPFIVSFHGTDATMADEYAKWSHITLWLYLRRRLQLVECVDRVIAQSEFVRAKLISQHGFPDNKISIVRHGVDLDNFNHQESSPEWGKILYVGRLIEGKGLNFLINALRLVRNKYPQVELTVIGDGSKRGYYESLAQRELEVNYEFLGTQSNTVVKEYLKRTYIFSMPSITLASGEAETLGVVFLEAQAMRVPVVSFNTGGIPEVVVHNETGFLATEGNVGELTHYLITLLDHPELHSRMGIAGRKRVEEIFDLDKQNRKLESIYWDVLSSVDTKFGVK